VDMLFLRPSTLLGHRRCHVKFALQYSARRD
jgi:hypothetical protein